MWTWWYYSAFGSAADSILTERLPLLGTSQVRVALLGTSEERMTLLGSSNNG